MKKINFILPFKARRPAGGFRVMYEYANRLINRGYEVHITYPISTQYMQYRLPAIVRHIMAKVEGLGTNRWFEFHPSITMSYAAKIEDKHVIDADIVIATWWATALEMGQLSKRKGKKINLIQGFENWEGHEDLLFDSYKMPDVTNIVVSNYLKQLVDRHAPNPSVLIHNAVDKNTFFVNNKIEERQADSVAMTYSIQDIKGSGYGLEALKLAKKKHPGLQAEFFGICPKPQGLPNWIRFHRAPNNLCEIYNSSAIFLSNSFTEGFPLTPAESLFCGCALICTDIDGHREFAKDNDTALLVNVKDAQQMAEKICYLIENNIERIALAKRGNEYIQQFAWNNAIEKMQCVIAQLLDE